MFANFNSLNYNLMLKYLAGFVIINLVICILLKFSVDVVTRKAVETETKRRQIQWL